MILPFEAKKPLQSKFIFQFSLTYKSIKHIPGPISKPTTMLSTDFLGIYVILLIPPILIDITFLLTNVLVFAIISGLLFNDPFGVINTISTLISGVGEKGLAGFISLAIIILIYRR